MKFFKKLAAFTSSALTGLAGFGVLFAATTTGNADLKPAEDAALNTTVDPARTASTTSDLANEGLRTVFTPTLTFSNLGGDAVRSFTPTLAGSTILDSTRFARVAFAENIPPVGTTFTADTLPQTWVVAQADPVAAEPTALERTATYLRGEGKGNRTTLRLLERAENGDMQATKDLASNMFNGIGMKRRDQALAIDLYRVAAQGGNNQAKMDLAYIEFHGLGGLQADRDGALARMREVNTPRAQMFVATWTGAVETPTPVAKPTRVAARADESERRVTRAAATRPADRAVAGAAVAAAVTPEATPVAVCTVSRDPSNSEISCKASRDTIRANEYVQLVTERGGPTSKLFMEAGSLDTAQFISRVLPQALAEFRTQQRRAFNI